MIEAIVPSSEAEWLSLRKMDVTSTESSALMGLSPYATPFELFYRKRDGLDVAFEPNDRIIWGNRLQDAIATGIAEDHGWEIRRMPEYLRDVPRRMGASFDFAIGDRGLLEVKNVDALAFRDGWIVDGDNVEAPPHIELQVQHQLAVSGRDYAYIGALVGGNRVVLIKREPDAKIIGRIHNEVDKFWNSIASDSAPVPDFSRDGDVIARLYGFSDPDKVFDARGHEPMLQLALRYRALGEESKRIDTERTAIKSEILMTIGDSEKVLGDGYSVGAGVVKAARVEAYDRAPYRGFRVNFKKEKS